MKQNNRYKRLESTKMLQIEFGAMGLAYLYDLYRWNFLISVLKKLLLVSFSIMQLHSCINLAHVYDDSSDSDSFNDCLRRVQMY